MEQVAVVGRRLADVINSSAPTASAAEVEAISALATTTGGGTGESLAEAAHLLRSMRAPTTKAMVAIKEINAAVINKGLLDGGATHALRKCRDLEKWRPRR